MIFFFNNTFNKVDKLDKIIEPIAKYYLNASISFFAANYLYNKLNNKSGITIERFFDIRYIIFFSSFMSTIKSMY